MSQTLSFAQLQISFCKDLKSEKFLALIFPNIMIQIESQSQSSP